jgi:hypothetical protein
MSRPSVAWAAVVVIASIAHKNMAFIVCASLLALRPITGLILSFECAAIGTSAAVQAQPSGRAAKNEDISERPAVNVVAGRTLSVAGKTLSNGVITVSHRVFHFSDSTSPLPSIFRAG